MGTEIRMNKPYTYVCTKCGSDSVSLEGFINWNVAKQEYEVSDLCDKGHSCAVCDGECRVEQLELPETPEEALNLIADLAQTFVEDWLSDDGMDDESRKEAHTADARMRAAVTTLRGEVAKWIKVPLGFKEMTADGLPK